MSQSYHLYGEGPHDVGQTTPDGRRETDGCYDRFLDRIRAEKPERPVPTCRRAGMYRQLLKKLPGGRGPRRGLKGFSLHAYLATMEATLDGADMVVLTADTDRGQGVRAGASLRKRRDKIVARFVGGHDSAVRDLRRRDPGVSVPDLVVAVPLLKLEAWLLADPAAFRQATGHSRPSLPKRPEVLGGKTDPKTLLERWGAEGRRLELAAHGRPSVLRTNCPLSYKPFCGMVEEALE